MKRKCTTPCDEDCTAPCHEAHLVIWKRAHQPEECPGDGDYYLDRFYDDGGPVREDS